MGRLYKKVIRDLFKDKRRAILSLLAILIGTMMFGIAMFANQIVPREINDTYMAMTPASAYIIVDRVDDNLIALTENFDGIASFEQRAFYQLRAQVGENEWAPFHLFSAENFDELQINQLEHEQGLTNPEFGEMLIERSATGIANATMGDTLPVVLPNGDTRDLPITGVVGDITVRQQANLHRIVQAYVSHETLLDMGLEVNRIDFIITGDPYDREQILSISDAYIALLEENGYVVSRLSVSNTPGLNRHLDEFETGAVLLLFFSIVSFLFGAMIMGNLISTIISGQTRQIGILKSVGASTGKITASYMLAFFSLLVLIAVISLGLSSLLAGVVSSLLLSIGNLRPADTGVPLYLHAIYACLALVVPMVIAYFPIRRGVSISVKDAINDYGISADVAQMKLPQPKHLSRPVVLSLRNAMRRKKRFLLNVAILSVAGVFFVSTVTSMASIQSVLSNNLDMWNIDYQISTPGVHSKDEISEIVANIETVTGYEVWSFSRGTIVNEHGELTNSYRIASPPADSEMIAPQLLAGRWLSEYDTNQIVLGHRLYDDKPDYRIGDTLALQIGNQAHEFEIIGVIEDFGLRSFFMSEHVFSQYVPEDRASGSIMLTLDLTEGARAVRSAINAELDAQGILISQTQTRDDFQATVRVDYDITLQVLSLIIGMFVIVSGFGLAATMNAQVAERVKELGIMKAMGASKKQMIRIITSESVFISFISWGVAVLVGIPVALFSLRFFGNMILEVPLGLNIVLLLASYAIWLIFTLAIGYFASRSCAKRAAKMSVKHSLTFE